MNTNTCPDPRCGGRVEPVTNGNGGLVDRCTKCNRTPQGARTALGIQRSQQTSTPPAPAPAAVPGNPGRACTVKGCPGKLDAAGACASCAKRQAYLDANLPKRFCEVCDGEISGGNRKFCDACAPIANKVKIAKSKQTAGAR